MDNGTSGSWGPREQLAFIREETRFEIGLLHERVNALVGAEAFLTIAFTAAMSNGTAWGATFSAVASPILSVLGLVLALLAWPGVDATVKIILRWTANRIELLESDPALSATPWGVAARGRADRRTDPDQWRSMLFFRAVPALFVLVWRRGGAAAPSSGSGSPAAARSCGGPGSSAGLKLTDIVDIWGP